MNFDPKYYAPLKFTKEQIDKNLENAIRDLYIAKNDNFLEVKFNYAYNGLIKAGIALLSYHNIKTKSVPGHHIKIIEKLADLLENEDIADLGNLMRSKRNLDFYNGGIEVTEKECKEYIGFVEKVMKSIQKILSNTP